jgi:hypothetical protein
MVLTHESSAGMVRPLCCRAPQRALYGLNCAIGGGFFWRPGQISAEIACCSAIMTVAYRKTGQGPAF